MRLARPPECNTALQAICVICSYAQDLFLRHKVCELENARLGCAFMPAAVRNNRTKGVCQVLTRPSSVANILMLGRGYHPVF